MAVVAAAAADDGANQLVQSKAVDPFIQGFPDPGELPCRKEMRLQGKRQCMASHKSPPMKPTILLIDDDLGVLQPLQEVVSDLGYETRAVSDPFEGMRIIESLRPALVITDLKMPGLDGLEVLKRIKDINASTQVVVISGHGSIDDAVIAMRRGAYDFVSKPFKIADIENVVLRALEKAALLNENLQLRERLKAGGGLLTASRSPVYRELLECALQAAG